VAEDQKLPEANRRVRRSSGAESAVVVAVGVCVLLAVVGFFVGINTASTANVAPCENGHYFPEGTTDFNCYVHPQGGLGVAIAVFSILLGTIVVFSSIQAFDTLRARAEAR
jgi:amino acid transporter